MRAFDAPSRPQGDRLAGVRVLSWIAEGVVDWLTFIVEFTKAAAWPAVTAGSVWLFRKQLALLISRGIRRIRLGPVEIEGKSPDEPRNLT